MLSPNFLRCKEEAFVPAGHPNINGAWRRVRCAWPRTHGPTIKHSFRFDDPGPPIRTWTEMARRVAWFVFALYVVIVLPLLLSGVIK